MSTTSLVFEINANAVKHRDDVATSGDVETGVVSYAADNDVFYGILRKEKGDVILLGMSGELVRESLEEQVVGEAIEEMARGIYSKKLSELLVETAASWGY